MNIELPSTAETLTHRRTRSVLVLAMVTTYDVTVPRSARQ
jgi:hypothetical protein